MKPKPNRKKMFSFFGNGACHSLVYMYETLFTNKLFPNKQQYPTFASRERLKTLLSAKWALHSQISSPFANVLPGNLRTIRSKN
jgi:hypothetical protein